MPKLTYIQAPTAITAANLRACLGLINLYTLLTSLIGDDPNKNIRVKEFTLHHTIQFDNYNTVRLGMAFSRTSWTDRASLSYFTTEEWLNYVFGNEFSYIDLGPYALTSTYYNSAAAKQVETFTKSVKFKIPERILKAIDDDDQPITAELFIIVHSSSNVNGLGKYQLKFDYQESQNKGFFLN